MSLAALVIILGVAGLMAYVRLAPADAALWHSDLSDRPAAIVTQSPDKVTQLPNGGYFDLVLSPDAARATLARLQDIALATPRTRNFAGSLQAGHITWETRSLLWGFPDYTTAQISPNGLTVFARQRFGSGDAGDNAARLRDWLAKLQAAGIF